MEASHLAGGIVMLIASVVAGLLWGQFGAAVTFYTGATFRAIALAGLARHPVTRLNAWAADAPSA